MNLALFDFDGTITFKDSFFPFIRYAVNPLRFALGRVVLLPLAVGYKFRIISSSATRACLAWYGLRGRRESDVRNAGFSFAHDILPQTIRKKALERIEWHKTQGDHVVVVSAALDVYLAAWCHHLGLDVICTELDVDNGILTGRYRGGDCTGKEKVRRIQEKVNLNNYEVIYAYGDTIEDNEMLQLASKRYFRWQEVSDGAADHLTADRVDLDPDR